MRGNEMLRLRKYIIFGAMVVAVTVMLDLLNWVPTIFQREGVRKYKTIEDAQGDLKLSKLFLHPISRNI